jgi:hypothetical protein
MMTPAAAPHTAPATQNIVFIFFDISFTGAWMSGVRNSFCDKGGTAGT